MLCRRVTQMRTQNALLVPKILSGTHTPTCPTTKKQPPGGVCGSGLKRAQKTGPVRLAFIPEEWFLFFYSKTGVTGPYLLGLTVTNYLVSKEIFVMEHEYYGGLSWLIVLYVGMTKLGTALAASFDKEIDDLVANWEKGRIDEMNSYEATIKGAKDAQWRAEGQQLLIEAKKENVSMQLEAVYRERCMQVYRTVKSRMDYHVKRQRAEARIHQKWMIGWILENVRKSIDPEFEKRALDQAIQDLAAAASRAK